jgi:hypothetical protein
MDVENPLQLDNDDLDRLKEHIINDNNNVSKPATPYEKCIIFGQWLKFCSFIIIILAIAAGVVFFSIWICLTFILGKGKL